jgi:hypothetical protein
MRKLILLAISLIALIFVSGCLETTVQKRNPTPNIELFEFRDTGNSVENEKICYNHCKDRENIEYLDEKVIDKGIFFTRELTYKRKYICEYESIICEGGICLCKTI